MEATTKDRLLEAGLGMLLAQGYNHLGIQELLESTGIPKGSFYHHFKSKEDFALQAVDRYMVKVHTGLDECLLNRAVAPLQRIRNFFEATRETYRSEGLLGCLLGGLGQELSGISEIFRARIEQCFGEIAGRIAQCLDEAVANGDLPRGTNAQQLANLLVNCWEGAALRTRLSRDASPLGAMLDFYFGAIPRPARLPRSAQSPARLPRPAQSPARLPRSAQSPAQVTASRGTARAARKASPARGTSRRRTPARG